MLHMLDGFAAAVGIEVPDKAVGDQANAGEYGALLARGPELVEPLAPVFRPAQLDAVKARRGRELPLLQDAVTRKDVLLTR
jgi:hypothetical protein